MKKYIVPAVALTAMQIETGVLTTSIATNYEENIGGEGFATGQLTNEMNIWDSWNEE